MKSLQISLTGILVTIVIWLAALVIFDQSTMEVVLPILIAGALFFTFCIFLKCIARRPLFGEIGFIYIGFVVAYTILPTVVFLRLNFDFPSGFDTLNFSVLNPSPEQIGRHLWRHNLFILGLVIGYLSLRGGVVSPVLGERFTIHNDKPTIVFLLSGLLVCIVAISVFSAPVDDYYDHYTRFDHLSWVLRRLLYIFIIFKTGGYYVLFALMFRNYKKYKLLVFFLLIASVGYEIIYSYGSRIEALSLLIGFAGFYHFKVKAIDLKKGALFLTILVVFFTLVESYRAADFDLNFVVEQIVGKGLNVAYEFGAVFYTSFHLYSERLSGSLPQHDWLMFFGDFLNFVPFVDHTEFNSQYWYARNYFPNAIVPPQTMGPLADSAIWGGEIDLFVRGLINGMLYALLARWFYNRQNSIWALVIYVYFYATCIVALKYSVFVQLSALARYVLPVIIISVLFKKSGKIFGWNFG